MLNPPETAAYQLRERDKRGISASGTGLSASTCCHDDQSRWWQKVMTAGRSIGTELAEWGKVALIETTGRTSGKQIQAAVGFVEGESGSLLVAAGSDASDWALNLRAQPRCRVTIGDRVGSYIATEIEEGPERARVLVELVLKYGTPAERLGRGPVFRLVPVN